MHKHHENPKLLLEAQALLQSAKESRVDVHNSCLNAFRICLHLQLLEGTKLRILPANAWMTIEPWRESAKEGATLLRLGMCAEHLAGSFRCHAVGIAWAAAGQATGRRSWRVLHRRCAQGAAGGREAQVDVGGFCCLKEPLASALELHSEDNCSELVIRRFDFSPHRATT